MQAPKESGLAKSSVQTVLEQLEFQRIRRPSWIAYHFPRIEERGGVEYSDVERMSRDEADSVRQLLIGTVIYSRKRIWRQKRGSITLLGEREGEPRNEEWSIRGRLIEEALKDICRTYDLPNPLREV